MAVLVQNVQLHRVALKPCSLGGRDATKSNLTALRDVIIIIYMLGA
jgi:hypothetical protein